MTDADLVVQVARLGRALRRRGVSTTVKDELDAASALPLIDLFDRAEVRHALRVTFKVRRRDWGAFDEEFDRIWGDEQNGAADDERARPPQLSERRGVPQWQWSGEPVGVSRPDDEREVPDGDTPGYSAERLLRHKPFDALTPVDVAAMERLLLRLVLELATRKSRRYVPARARGRVDLRRSLRRAVASSGELVRLARRERAREEVDLVLLCDTSGSMDPHTRFLLTFLFALKRVARRTEVFAFNTSLTRLTPWIAPGKIGPTLDRLAAGVPDWSGGTRIGASLAEFVSRYQNQMVTSRTVVVIASDGLDTGEPADLARAMRAIQRRARKVIWINPLLGDDRYEPTARGMQAALPFVDHFAPAHTLDALEKLLPALVA